MPLRKESLMGLLDRFKNALPARGAPEETARSPERASSWTTQDEWRSWDAPLSIVAGESHYSAALHEIAGPPRPEGWLVPCEAVLQREPHNRHDPDAIAVLINGTKVGYIAADASADLAPMLDKHGGNARMRGVPALVRGGWPDKPNLGVMLWLNHPEVRETLPDLDWDWLIDEFSCHGWPPEDGGSFRPTSIERHRSTSSRQGTTPRTPPLTEHFTDYVEDVKELKRRKEQAEVEVLLLALIEAVEAESEAQGVGVALVLRAARHRPPQAWGS